MANDNPNQQNRPQQNQQSSNRPNTQPVTSNIVSTEPAPASASGKSIAVPKEINKANYSFKEMIGLLITKVIADEISVEQSRKLLRTWFISLTEAEKQEFIQNRVVADDALNFYKGLIDTYIQDFPYLITT